MATVISKIGIKDSTGSGYDTRDIGAKGQNVEVGYDADGKVIIDVDKQTPTTTKTLTTVLQENDNTTATLNKEKAPNNHRWADNDATDYGKADATHYGHIKPGTGLYIDSDAKSTTYGSTNVSFAEDKEVAKNKAVQANDTRLANDRKNPNAVTFSDGINEQTYDGSAALTVNYNTVGSAPAGHTAARADAVTLGHVTVSTGLTSTDGALSVAYGSVAGTACQGNDSRLSDSRIPESHAATSTTYGGGTSSNYGHVKLEDTYTSVNSGETAANSVAASAYALQSAYSTLNSKVTQITNSLSSSSWSVKALYPTTNTGLNIYLGFNKNAPVAWKKGFALIFGINNVSGCILEIVDGYIKEDKQNVSGHYKSYSTTTMAWGVSDINNGFNCHSNTKLVAAAELLVFYHGFYSVGLF